MPRQPESIPASPSPDGGDPDGALPDAVEDALIEIVGLPDREQDEAVRNLALAHPTLRAAIERRHEANRKVGARTAPALGEALPPRFERIGPYRIVGRLGAGGMGFVLEGELCADASQHPRQADPLPRHAAIKVMMHACQAQAQARFLREMAVLAILQHKSIARLHLHGTVATEQGPVPWFAMELVMGARDLLDHAAHAGLAWRARVELLTRAVEAVAHAHTQGVVHRDLKPSNVLVSANGELKLIDFGIARAVGDALRLTQPQVAAGTPLYMSPEQRLASPASPRDDVWALGAMLCEILMPTWQDVPPLEHRRLRVILAMCGAPAAGRYRDAGELLVDLRALAAGQTPLAARLRGRARRALALLRQRQRRALAGVAALGAVVAVALWVPLAADSARPTQAAGSVPGPASDDLRAPHFGRLSEALRGASEALRDSRYDVALASTVAWTETSIAARMLHAMARNQGTVHEVDCGVGAIRFRRLAGCTAGVVLTAGGTLRTLDPSTATCYGVLRVDGAGWTAFDCTADGSEIACGQGDGTVCLATGARRWSAASVSTAPCVGVHIDPHARFVVVCHQDGALALLSSQDGHVLHTEHDQRGVTTGSALAPDGNVLAVVYESGVLALRDIDEQGRFSASRQMVAGANASLGSARPLRAVAFLPDGKSLLLVGDRGVVATCSGRVAGNEPMFPLGGCEADLRAVAVSPNGRLVAAAGTDRRMYVWRTGAASPAAISPAWSGELPTDLVFLSNSVLFLLDGSRRAHGWEMPAVSTKCVEGHLATAWKSRLSPNGREVATVGNDETLRLWSTATHAPVAALRGHENRVLDVTWSPDGRQLATASSDGMVRVWDKHSGTATVLRGHTDEVCAVQFVGGDALLSAGKDGTVRRWDPASGATGVVFREPFEITAAAIELDGAMIALGGSDGVVVVREGDQRRVLRGTASRVLSLAFTVDGRLLAVGRNDGTVQVFDQRNPATAVVTMSSAGMAWSLAFTAGDQELCWVDESGTLRVWNVDGRDNWAWPLPGLDGPPMSLDVAPDGSALWLVTANGALARVSLVASEWKPEPAPRAEIEPLLSAWRQRFADSAAAAAAAAMSDALLPPLRTEIARRLRLEGDNPDIEVMDSVLMCARADAPRSLYELAAAKLELAGPKLSAWRASDLPTRRALVSLRLGEPRVALALLEEWRPPTGADAPPEGPLYAAFVRARAWQVLGQVERAGQALVEFQALVHTPRWRSDPIARQFAVELGER